MFYMLRAHREVRRQHEKLSEPVWGEPFMATTCCLASLLPALDVQGGLFLAH